MGEGQGSAPAPAPEEIDVDKLLSEINSPAEPRALGGEAPAAAAAKAEAATPWWGREFDAGGKKVKADSEEKAWTWLQQGHNYSQRAAELNQKQALWEQRQIQWDKERLELLDYKKKLSPYQEIDQYAVKNPDWWKHVKETYKARELPQGLDPNIAKVIQPLQDTIAQLSEKLSKRDQDEQAAQQKEELTRANALLDQQVDAVRKENPKTDLSAKDESGETLERRILKHMLDNGINNFRAGFRDYLHDQLVTGAKAEGKDAIAREQAVKTKRGIGGVSPSPAREVKPVNPKVSWNDPSLRGENILKEAGFG